MTVAEVQLGPRLARSASRRIRHLARPGTVPSCQAPFGSMYLDPFGDVRACCLNPSHPMGNITQGRLLDIWRGAPAEELRDAVLHGDWTKGCDQCAWQAERDRVAVAARFFDKLDAWAPTRPWPVQIEFSISITCNLQCRMCNGDFSSAIRRHREHRDPLPTVYDDRFFDDLAQFLPHLRYANFVGGEPFLGRETAWVWELMATTGSRAVTTIVTNGTIWNAHVERVLETLQPRITVSFDGTDAATFESIRVGADFDEVMANVDRFQASPARDVSFLHCLMVDNWRTFGDLLRLGDERGMYVGMTTVTDPPSMSLFHLARDEFAAVLAELERRDGEMTRTLQRNRRVWIDQLARLRAHLRLLDSQALVETAVAISLPQPDPVPPADLEAWAGTGLVGWLELDDDDTISGGRAAGLFAGAAGLEQVFAGRTLAQLAESVSGGPPPADAAGPAAGPLDVEVHGSDGGRLRLILGEPRAGVPRVAWVGRRLGGELRGAEGIESARSLLAAWAGRDAVVHELVTGREAGVAVRSTAFDHALGSDLSDVAGSSGDDLLAVIQQRTGRSLEVTLRTVGAIEPAEADAAATDGSLAAKAILIPQDDGTTAVLLALRRSAG